MCYRHSLFGGSSVKIIDADLGRLFTATSLMQIDDNIMRYEETQQLSVVLLMFTVVRVCLNIQLLAVHPYLVYLLSRNM